jgi:tetratricopeptide (TPR) repeat protein
MKFKRLLVSVGATVLLSISLCVGQARADVPLWQQRIQEAQRKFDATEWPRKEEKARAALEAATSHGIKGKELAQLHENLADAIFYQTRYADATNDYQAALNIREQCFPPDSTEVAESLYGLGYCLAATDQDVDAATGYLNRSLNIYTKKFGPDAFENYKPLAMLLIIDIKHRDIQGARQKQDRLLVLDSHRKGVTVDELYASNYGTGAIRELAGDKQGAKQAYLKVKEIKASMPAGYFPPDNLDEHLNWADNRLYRPQDISYQPLGPSHYQPPVHHQPPPTRPVAPVTPPATTTQPTPPPSTPYQPPSPPTEYTPPTPPHITAMQPPPPPAEASHYKYYVEGKSVSYNTYKSRVLFNEAGDYVKEKQYGEAKTRLEEAIGLDNHFAAAMCALGTVMAHLGAKDDAVMCIKSAIELNPQLDSAWIALAGIQEEVGKLSEALDAYRQFLRRFPNDPSYAIILSTTRLAEREMNARNTPSKCPHVPGSDGVHDYLTYAAHDGIARWSKSDFPLAVYVKPAPASVANVNPEKLLRQCLSEWQSRTGNVACFKEASSPSNAQIVVGWVTADGELAEDAEAGEARVLQVNGTIDKANVSIDLRKPDQEAFAGKLHTTMLHELGHCLGLHGHSPSPDDVMYFTELMTGPIPGLSARDVKTLELLYSSNISMQP